MLPPVAQTRWMALAMPLRGQRAPRTRQRPALRVRDRGHTSRRGRSARGDAFGVRKLGKKLVHPLILDRIAAAHEGRMSAPTKPEARVPRRGRRQRSGCQRQNPAHRRCYFHLSPCQASYTGNAWALQRNSAPHCRTPFSVQKGHAAGSTAHAAGQVDEERMLFIDDDVQSVELLFSVGARPRCSRGRGS